MWEGFNRNETQGFNWSIMERSCQIHLNWKPGIAVYAHNLSTWFQYRVFDPNPKNMLIMEPTGAMCVLRFNTKPNLPILDSITAGCARLGPGRLNCPQMSRGQREPLICHDRDRRHLLSGEYARACTYVTNDKPIMLNIGITFSATHKHTHTGTCTRWDTCSHKDD